MGDVVNLRLARKHKARGAAEAEASVNRSLHALPKNERKAAKARAAKEKCNLDARRLDREIND